MRASKIGKMIFGLALAVMMMGPAGPAAQAQGGGCMRRVFLPVVTSNYGDDSMRNLDQTLEQLLRRPADFPFDGRIVEIFTESVSVKRVGSDTVERNVSIPAHMVMADLRKGLPVKLGEHQGRPILLAVLPQLALERDYAGRGSFIPDPPFVRVQATTAGWLVSWPAVPGASRYRVYRNDTPDELSPDEVGETSQISLTVGYEAPFVYFAVRAVSGLNESELSNWATDDTPPPAPTTFAALNEVDGHRLTIGGDDAALSSGNFKCYELEQAEDGSGTGTVNLGYFYPANFPVVRGFAPGVVRYYRLRAINWAGYASAWTVWDFAYAGEDAVQDKFDGYGGSESSTVEGLHWLQMSQWDFEGEISEAGAQDAWNAVPYTPYTLEKAAALVAGNQAVRAYGDGSITYTDNKLTLFYHYSTPLDMQSDQRLEGTDKILLALHIADVTDLNYLYMQFSDSSGHIAVSNQVFSSSLQTGLNFVQLTLNNFSDFATLDLSAIVQITFYFNIGSTSSPHNLDVTLDDLRIVKADPDDATDTNDTGRAWDKAAQTGSEAGVWHIYAGNRTGEPGKPFSYGQIRTAASPSQWYLSHKPLAETVVTVGTIQTGVYLKGADGQAGLAFFVQDTTPGSWAMYAVEVDSGADQVRLVKWVGGTRTVISTAVFVTAPNQLVWLGADFKDYEREGGRLRVYASRTAGNLIQATNLKISAQDTTWVGNAGGSVGLLSQQANARFVDFAAGSPAHAEVADVAKALDGPIVVGETKRVRYNNDDDAFEWSEDGVTWTSVNADINAHLANTSNPHSVTAAQVGAMNSDGNYIVMDTRSVDTPTDLGDRGVKFEFKANTIDGLSDGGTYHGVITFQPWSDSSGGNTHQLGFTQNGNVYCRTATIGGTWGSWKLIINNTDAQTISGVKTFSSFPVTPSSAPTTDYQVANKKYVDDNVAGYLLAAYSFVELSSDVSTTSTSWVDLLSTTIAISSGDIVEAVAYVNAICEATGTITTGRFRLYVDGNYFYMGGEQSVVVGNGSNVIKIRANISKGVFKTGLSAGTKTVKIQYAVNSGTTCYIRPSASSGDEVAALVVKAWR